MSDITLSKAVRSNLLNLQTTAGLLSKSQERLSSGLRVNTALDNPTNFFTAQGLNSRASDLSQLADAVSNAVQTVAAADKGITAITKLVESAQATARQALQTAAEISTTTVSAQAAATGNVAIAADATSTATGSTTLTGSNNSNTIFGAGDEFTITVGSTDRTYTFTADSTASSGTTINLGHADVDTISELLAYIQADLRANGDAAFDDATVSLNGNNAQITLGSNTTASFTTEFTSAGSTTGFGIADATYDPSNSTITALFGQSLTVGGNTLTFGAGSAGISNRAELVARLGTLSGGISGSINGSNFLTFTGSGGNSFTVGGTAAAGLGVTAQTYSATSSTSTAANPKRQELVETYNDLLGQIDALAKDASFNGVNLLNGDDLSVLFNEDGSSKIDIKGVDNTFAGLGLATLDDDAFDTNSGVNTVLDSLKGVIDTLRGQSAKFGSNLSVVETRQDFTKQMINVLQTGAANLTLADTNEEAANVLALQTRQQLSSTALSLASQADQNVLRLF
jgi:flagellin